MKMKDITCTSLEEEKNKLRQGFDRILDDDIIAGTLAQVLALRVDDGKSELLINADDAAVIAGIIIYATQYNKDKYDEIMGKKESKAFFNKLYCGALLKASYENGEAKLSALKLAKALKKNEETLICINTDMEEE